MDKMTEMVAHMVGIFQTTLEEERMREAYDKFKALIAANPENDPLGTAGITFTAKYALEGFTPSLRYSDGPSFLPASDVGYPFFADGYFPDSSIAAAIAAGPVGQATYGSPVSGPGRATLSLEPPASVAVITAQHAYLTDNDLIILGNGDTVFTDPNVFLEQLQNAQSIALSIAAPVASSMITPGDTAGRDAIGLHDTLASAQASTVSGVTSEMIHGHDASGLHINGDLSEVAPVLEELLPAFKTQDDDPAETTLQDPAPIDPFEGLDAGYSDTSLIDIEDGHAVVTGANLLVNEVVINSAWLDAPVMSVMGDVITLDVISQVNMLMDRDSGMPSENAASVAINAASLLAISTTPAPDAEAEVTGGLPSNWAVTRIDGDLIAVNQITQFSFVTDYDSAEISFGSANTYIGMGDNSVLNLTDLSELGFGYDLIMVGGDMISLNWVSQINVLIDNDAVTMSGAISASLSGGDNLLFNNAEITSTGVDTYTDMQDNFAAASDQFADGAQTINTSVAHDSVFEGIEILRVLYIEGDLTTINWVEQTNILGDSDQVHLAMENLEGSTGLSATVTTGSNATLNLATINEFGVDSVVSVQGEVYDDALLYQAELIDTDADPLGVDMPALANEAVAFLAEDMMGPESAPEDGAIVATASESTASSDVMQSMLA
ncbi:type I secretion protein ATPase [uncultured Litoreibacter sp.]|uniref:type I secretion protein ATPase n=1 Tax=uncultured Litoreibacter sp. TaxID=1392394 RepID=UPI00261C583B|nr:type I secretion protein ATPase [uncultured Litoreibacter sp.]